MFYVCILSLPSGVINNNNNISNSHTFTAAYFYSLVSADVKVWISNVSPMKLQRCDRIEMAYIVLYALPLYVVRELSVCV